MTPAVFSNFLCIEGFLTKSHQLSSDLADAAQELVQPLLRLVAVHHEAMEHLLQLPLHTGALLHGSDWNTHHLEERGGVKVSFFKYPYG